MSKRLSFKEFKEAVDNRRLPLEKIEDYAQLDADSPIPKIVFKPDALLDEAPDGYDLDREIYTLTQHYREMALQQESTFSPRSGASRSGHSRSGSSRSFFGGKKVVAEGDSWFNLPPLIRPTAIADRMWWNGTYNIKNIAYWGHTIKLILNQKQHLTALRAFQPDYFLLSAGGNDIQQGLATGRYLNNYDPAKPLNDHLSGQGKEGLKMIADSYRTLLKEVTSEFPNLVILTHGYDYPRPLVKGGRYIGQFLRRQGFPDSAMSGLIEPVIDKLNSNIESVSKEFSNVHFIDCRNITEEYTWYDDMHPSSEGFLALTREFEETMISIG